MHDTIVAIATPSGIGGICIVRLSGSRALEIATQITKKPTFTPRYATLSSLYDELHTLIDEAIVLYFAAPKSYTCEEVVEFQCHGGELIGTQVVQACIKRGARMARAGEFTKRAVLAGRIDVAQANAIAQMINAQDVSFQRAMAQQLKGDLGQFVAEIKGELLNALAHTEVMIDYSEEDIPSDIITRIDSMLRTLCGRLKRIYDFSTTRASDELRLALIGKPNAGKSSLLNAILLYDRAITSPIAGTTRDRIEEHITIANRRMRLIDTAGIRTSGDEIESQGIQKSKQALQECHIALVVFDGSGDLNALDTEVIALVCEQYRANPALEILLIINKADKPQRLSDEALLRAFSDIKPIESNTNTPAHKREKHNLVHINALDKESSAQTLHHAIAEILRHSSLESHNDLILSAPYQQEALAHTIAHIHAAQEKLNALELELFAYHIKDALESIGFITSPYNSEEVLDRMFAEFCLGK